MSKYETTIGKLADVTVNVGTATKTKPLKVCKVKARSLLFIEVDRENRKNVFYKFPVNTVESFIDGDTPKYTFKNGTLPEKWDSDWSNVGNFSAYVHSTVGTQSNSNKYGNYSSYGFGGGSNFRT
jgi:hypothetical protein|tara:strand:- start:2148 stop:2522 length:375 start_codon:yes stop_codon:yes gene_type:complete